MRQPWGTQSVFWIAGSAGLDLEVGWVMKAVYFGLVPNILILTSIKWRGTGNSGPGTDELVSPTCDMFAYFAHTDVVMKQTQHAQLCVQRI